MLASDDHEAAVPRAAILAGARAVANVAQSVERRHRLLHHYPPASNVSLCYRLNRKVGRFPEVESRWSQVNVMFTLPNHQWTTDCKLYNAVAAR